MLVRPGRERCRSRVEQRAARTSADVCRRSVLAQAAAQTLAARRRRRCRRGSTAITSGSCIGPRRCSRTRRDRSGVPRRRCSSSILTGNLVSSWGGAGKGTNGRTSSTASTSAADEVWLGGGGEKDAQILKFTRAGRFLLQIGRKGQGRGSNDTAESRRRRQPDRRSRRQRAVCGRRLRQSSRHRL